MEDNKNKYTAISEVSLSLGIISIISFLFWYISMPSGILAIILGAKGIKKTGKKTAKAGMITGIIGLSIFAFVYISLIIILLLAGI